MYHTVVVPDLTFADSLVNEEYHHSRPTMQFHMWTSMTDVNIHWTGDKIGIMMITQL